MASRTLLEPGPVTPCGARFVPERSLPRRRYRPGRTPSVDRPGIHDGGKSADPLAPPDPTRWRECADYLYGIDLFNHGFYWEAHEAWESLWHAAGRRGPTAAFLKGMIALAATGLKLLDGNVRGAKTHASRAAALFHDVRESASVADPYMGLDLSELEHRATEIARRAGETVKRTDAEAPRAFDFVLWPNPRYLGSEI